MDEDTELAAPARSDEASVTGDPVAIFCACSGFDFPLAVDLLRGVKPLAVGLLRGVEPLAVDLLRGVEPLAVGLLRGVEPLAVGFASDNLPLDALLLIGALLLGADLARRADLPVAIPSALDVTFERPERAVLAFAPFALAALLTVNFVDDLVPDDFVLVPDDFVVVLFGLPTRAPVAAGLAPRVAVFLAAAPDLVLPADCLALAVALPILEVLLALRATRREGTPSDGHRTRRRAHGSAVVRKLHSIDAWLGPFIQPAAMGAGGSDEAVRLGRRLGTWQG